MLGAKCSPCCGPPKEEGWYCYGNSCQYYDAADTKESLWNCGEDQIPPDTIQLQATYSGATWSQLESGQTIQYDASTELNTVLALTKQTLYERLFWEDSNDTYFKCAYAAEGYENAGSNLRPGVNWAAVLPYTDRRTNAFWQGYVNAGIYVRRYENGVLSAGEPGYLATSYWPKNTTYVSDVERFITTNHTLRGLRWTLSRIADPKVVICTLEVVG